MKKPLVFIVDDVEENISILYGILQNEGYRFALATSSREMRSAFDREKPDLILLDVMMPEESGFELLQQLRKDGEIGDIPVIFITARTGIEDKVYAFDIGGVDYITKPFQGEEVLARVRTHIELKQSRDRQKELIQELQQALDEVKQLRGIIPICANCKKVRNDQGYWQQVEEYISKHSELEFSHGLCPNCLHELYPDLHNLEEDDGQA